MSYNVGDKVVVNVGRLKGKTATITEVGYSKYSNSPTYRIDLDNSNFVWGEQMFLEMVEHTADYIETSISETDRQNRLWNFLSDKEKENWKEKYRENMSLCNNVRSCCGYVTALVEVFGSHNITQAKSPKTWADILEGDYSYAITLNSSGFSKEMQDKAEVTLMISKLIEEGYGGQITEEEWHDDSVRKYTVRYAPHDKRRLICSDYCIGDKHFIAFHRPDQRDEFLSYESNRELVRKYFGYVDEERTEKS